MKNVSEWCGMKVALWSNPTGREPSEAEVKAMSAKSAVGLLALVLSMSAPAFPAEVGTGGTAGEPSRPSLADKPAEKSDFMRKQAEGTVVSVSPDERTLVIVEAERRLRMTFIVADSAAEDMSNIRAGDQVTIQYTEEGRRIIAQEINKA